MKKYKENDKVIFTFPQNGHNKIIIDMYSRETCENFVKGINPLDYSPILKLDASKYDTLPDAINGCHINLEHAFIRAFGFDTDKTDKASKTDNADDNKDSSVL